MRVQRVVMPGFGAGSWTVLGDDHVPVEPVERFLAYLSSVERSPNTVKAYAHDLKDWFTFLAGLGRDWRAATLEDVAGFVAWLRLRPAARAGRVTVLPSVEHHCSAASVNRKLAALTSFCEFHARHGVRLAGLLVGMQPAGRGRYAATSFKPFLHHISNSGPQRQRTIKLTAPARRARILTAREVQNDPGRLRASAGCCWIPGSGSVKRSGFGMRTLQSPSGRSISCHGSTTTAPAPRAAGRERSRPAPS
jgi:integrase/recombinase XerD